MFRSGLTVLTICTLFSSAYAQIIHSRRRHDFGRVIAGCVIGGLALVLFLVGFCLLARRRRTRDATFRSDFSGQPPHPYPTGWSSGPYQGHQSVPPPPPPPPPPPHGQYGTPGMTHHDLYGWPGQQGPDAPKYPTYPPPYAADGNPYSNQFSYSPPAVPPSAYAKPGNS